MPPTLRSGTPAKPTTHDSGLLAKAQAAELAVHELYLEAAKVRTFSDEQRQVLEVFGANHLAYAQVIGGAIGKVATNLRDDEIVREFRSDMFSPARAMTALQELENTLVSTHTALIGQLQAVAGAELVASIAMVEARHAATLALLRLAGDVDGALANPTAPLPLGDVAAVTATTTTVLP